MLQITALYASLLAFIYIKLSTNVIKLRRLHKVSLGHKNHQDLEQAIRAQANFIEYVPFGLILLSCLEINKIHPVIVFLLGGLLLIGRFLHAKSFTMPNIDKTKRVQGMKFTFWSIRLMAAMLIFSLLISLI
ncbi:MAPEG family protein [Methylophilaceae bacterium]|nr:MAPEG family protein [Methylophilaceae bacterium]|tara:strand:- start:4498 stop:4893 length:396 start_codon:yes stop_codon:yes gene_type:complete